MPTSGMVDRMIETTGRRSSVHPLPGDDDWWLLGPQLNGPCGWLPGPAERDFLDTRPPYCIHCQSTSCTCHYVFGFRDQTAPYLPGWQAPVNILAGSNHYEAAPPDLQAMEGSSSGAGTLAAQPAPIQLPTNPYTADATAGMTDAIHLQSYHPMTAPGLFPERYEDVLERDVRQSVELDGVSDADSEAAMAANILANGPLYASNGTHESPEYNPTAHAQTGFISSGANIMRPLRDDEQPSADFTGSPRDATAYAKLLFPDGDLLVTVTDLTLGRNMAMESELRTRRKQETRARQQLKTYRKEPSQPSQPGDGDQQNEISSQSLEGRPAPASTYSEPGGIMAFTGSISLSNDEREDWVDRRPKYKRLSSSTNSIAPATLHPSFLDSSQIGIDGDDEDSHRTAHFVGVHPNKREHIGHISRRHLLFRYHFRLQQWELHILGNGAFVNGERWGRHAVVPLNHNDEIMISSLRVVFKLPDNRNSPGLSQGPFSRDSDIEMEEDEEEEALTAVSTSPVRRLSNAMGLEDSDEEAVESKGRKKIKSGPKLKPLKLAKTKVPDKAKKTSPETSKKVDKPKKPSTAQVDQSPPEPPVIKPGSALEGIPIEHLPEKRKGPGRPPKEGNVSKRDMSLANRKKRELEKAGQVVPPFNVLVDIVRKEAKQKELQAKIAAGVAVPTGSQVAQSIETDANGVAYNSSVKLEEGASASSNLHNEPTRKSSPKPKRTIKSPSPIKPMSDFTEEELKKPPATYLHILDEILNDHPTGQADLQEIYDRIMKRYPYFKYKVDTTGWQSSVRHNLLQNKRFKDIGKSGKGKLWAIDPEVPLEKEKKRKSPPPPRPPMQNGHYMPGQMPYGQPQYGTPYGQHQPYGMPPGGQPGQGGYYSPYAQTGQYGSHPQAGPSRLPNGQPQPPHYGQNQQGGPPQQPNDAGQQKWQDYGGLVPEIMNARVKYLAPITDKAIQAAKGDMFHDVTTVLSDGYHHKARRYDDLRQTLETEEQRVVFDLLKPIFVKYHTYEAAANEAGTAAGEVKKATENADAAANMANEQAAAQSSAHPASETATNKRSAEDDGEDGHDSKRPRSSGAQ